MSDFEHQWVVVNYKNYTTHRNPPNACLLPI
jgi:hypothetical protein